jgi:glycosyltransferase involved in cell wall biosynthesis
MDRSRVGIVIPALNESATISRVVESAILFGVPIVVDDGSTDNTAAIAKRQGAVVVSHDRNLGYDASLNTGFNKASALGFDIIISMDADGQHSPDLLPKFINLIETGIDIVVGVRNHRQRLAEHLFAWYTHIKYGIIDPLCGLKAYRTLVYREYGRFDSYGSIGTELTLFAAKKGYRLAQLSVDCAQRQDNSRFGRTFWANYKIFRAMALSVWKIR